MEREAKDRIVAYFEAMTDDSPMQPAIDMLQSALGRELAEAEYTNVFLILGDIDRGDYAPLWDYMDVLAMWDR